MSKRRSGRTPSRVFPVYRAFPIPLIERGVSRLAGRACAVGAFAVATLAAGPVFAAPEDGAALRLDDTAMNQEYLATRFQVAIDTLKSALTLCGDEGCSGGVRAQILRDMGVVYMAGLKDEERAKESFKQAIAADPGIALDPALTNPAIQKAFDDARGQGGGASAKPRKKHAGKAHSGLVHTPVERQQIGTPVPVYVELSSDIEASMVRLYFKGPGMDSWDSVKMKKVGDGYGAEIPCSALPAHGSVLYYLRALDDDAVVAKAGSAEDPFEVELVDSLDPDDAPHLPGRDAPARCEGAGAASAGGGGQSIWLMAGLSQEMAFISGTDVCTQDSQLNSGYACFRSSGSQYHGTPLLGAGDKINAGFALATTRVLIGGEYPVSSSISLGVRLGYVLRGGGPRPDGGHAFMPFHAEARASYWFADKGINSAGLAPFVFAGGGLAQVDAKHTVPVAENTAVPPPPNQQNPAQQDLEAWKKMGTSFGELGAGVYYPIGKTSGLLADLKGMLLLPSSGTAASIELGYAFGL